MASNMRFSVTGQTKVILSDVEAGKVFCFTNKDGDSDAIFADTDDTGGSFYLAIKDGLDENPPDDNCAVVSIDGKLARYCDADRDVTVIPCEFFEGKKTDTKKLSDVGHGGFFKIKDEEVFMVMNVTPAKGNKVSVLAISTGVMYVLDSDRYVRHCTNAHFSCKMVLSTDT